MMVASSADKFADIVEKERQLTADTQDYLSERSAKPSMPWTIRQLDVGWKSIVKQNELR